MSIQIYQFIHVVSVMLIFVALSAIISGGTQRLTKASTILHGVALILLLISGFGLLAKFEIMGTSKFWIVKFIIWLAIGASLVLAKRKLLHEGTLITIIIFLGVISAYLGIYKPF